MLEDEMLRRSKIVLLCAVLLCCLVPPQGAPAQSASSSIARGFKTDTGKGEIVRGALVSSRADNPGTVELANNQNASRLAGVADSDSLLVISNAAEQADIVVSGATVVIVSDLNGAIVAGDKITPSPIAGVGMRATADSQVVGTAEASFKSAQSQTHTINRDDGSSQTVHIGYVPVQVDIAFYRAPGSDYLPPILQRAADGIAGKHVSLVRIALVGLLLLAALIGIGVLISSSIRSALVSIGRNPLAGGDIRKSLLQVGIASLGLLGMVLLACYLILSI